jgi:hypothetical protein
VEESLLNYEPFILITTMSENVEKVYVERPGVDAGTLAALMNNGNNGFNAADIAALTKGGMDSQWNNPFIYLVWMMFANRFVNGNNGGTAVSDGVQNAEMMSQLSAIRETMANNQNSNLLMDSIRGNGASIHELANNLNVNYGNLASAICDVRSAIERIGGEIGYSSEKVINSVILGNKDLVSAINNCCCSVQQNILKMGYESQLQNQAQTNILQSQINTSTNVLQSAVNTVATGMERGFSAISNEAGRHACEIITAGNQNTQRLIDTMNNHWQAELQDKLAQARLELSQKNQNEYLIAQLKTT